MTHSQHLGQLTANVGQGSSSNTLFADYSRGCHDLNGSIEWFKFCEIMIGVLKEQFEDELSL